MKVWINFKKLQIFYNQITQIKINNIKKVEVKKDGKYIRCALAS